MGVEVVRRRRSVVGLYVVVGRTCDIGRLEGLGIQARIFLIILAPWRAQQSFIWFVSTPEQVLER